MDSWAGLNATDRSLYGDHPGPYSYTHHEDVGWATIVTRYDSRGDLDGRYWVMTGWPTKGQARQFISEHLGWYPSSRINEVLARIG